MAEDAELSFEQRLERLIYQPEQIDDLWVKLSGPLLRLFGVEPRIETKQLEAYVAALGKDLGPHQAVPLVGLQKLAREEFGQNLSSLERCHQLHGAVESRLLNWLVRMKTVFDQADRMVERIRGSRKRVPNIEAAKRALEMSSHKLLPGLRPQAAASPRAVPRLASIDALLDAAESERDFLGRRRHLLEAARELLLDASASIANQADVAPRLEHAAREIGELNRLEAAGVKADVALSHQLKQAWATRSPQRLNAILSTLESHALRSGDARVSDLSSLALNELWQSNDRFSAEHQLSSLARSADDAFQPEVLEAARRGMANARAQYEEERIEKGRLKFDAYFDRVARSFLQDTPDTELIQAALYVDGCVDVGGVLSPHRVFDPVDILREVRHPTQQMTLKTAHDVDDVRDALIADPRTLLADLATQKLLTRRFLGVEKRQVERRVMASEVRVFLLDGSGSMLGPRARMRDAIVVAELSTMLARLNDKDRWLTPTLYYSYFNDELGPIHKVATQEEAIEAVEEVLGRLRYGGTDIEGALLRSFETVRTAQEDDPELLRAQIVLITDGAAEVDEREVTRHRESVGNLPIGVSIIALGEENRALKALAARQRERGERVFYQFLHDRALKRLAKGERLSLSLHLPDSLADAPLQETLGTIVAEIAVLSRERDDTALASVHDEKRALAEVGLNLGDLPMTEQARILSLSRDYETLNQRFNDWFPPQSIAEGERGDVARKAVLSPSKTDAEEIASIEALLSAVAEVTDLVGSEEHRRKQDAVEAFERLLLERGSSFIHYRKLLERYPRVFDDEIASVRRAAGV